MLQQWVLLVCVVIVVFSYCEQRVQAQFHPRGFGFPPRYPYSPFAPHRGLLGGRGAHRRPHLGWVLAANPNAHEDDGDKVSMTRSAGEEGYDEALQVVHSGDHVEELQDLGFEPSALIGFYNEDGTIGEWAGEGEELVTSGAEEMVGKKHRKLDCDDVFGRHKKKKRKFCRKMKAYNDEHHGGHDSYGHGSYGGHKQHKHHKHGSYGRYKRQLQYLSGAGLPLQQLPLGGITTLTHSVPLAGTLRQLPVQQLAGSNRPRPGRDQGSYRRHKRQLPYLSDAQLPLQELPLGIPQLAQATPLTGAVQLLPVQQITQINRPRLVRNSSLKAPVKRQLFNNPNQIFPPIGSAGSSPEERRHARQKYFADLRNSRAGFFENVGKAFQGMRPRAAPTTTTPAPFPVIAAIRKNFESSMQNLNSRLAYRDPMIGAGTSTAPSDPVPAGPVVAPAPSEPCTCDKCTPVRRNGQRGQRRNRNGGPAPRQRPRARGRNSDPTASSASSLAAEIKQAAPASPIVGAPAPAASAAAKPAVTSSVYPREIANSFLNAVNKFISVPAAPSEMVGSSAQGQQPVDPARTISKTIARVIDYMYPDQAPPAATGSASELVGSVGPKVSAPKQSDLQFVEGMQRMLNTYQKELVGKKSCSGQGRCR